MANGGQILGVVFTLGMIALAVVSLIGLVYLTKFSFSSNRPSDSDQYCVKMSSTERQLSQVTVVLAWIQIAIPALLAFLALVYWLMNTNRSLQFQLPVVLV